MIELRRLSKAYGANEGLVVLRDIGLRIETGEFCALTGASGSGKTTLMNLMGLLDRPTAGDIEIAGMNTSMMSADAIAGLRNRMIGFVFQSFHLLPRYSSLDNVALPLVYRGIGRSRRREMAAESLRQVGLSDRITHRPDELSGGQRQRVAIARALIGGPNLLLADEPTGNLDSRTADEIMSLFLQLNADLGLTVILVTHDPTIAARCPRRIVMRDGCIEDDDFGSIRKVGSA